MMNIKLLLSSLLFSTLVVSTAFGQVIVPAYSEPVPTTTYTVEPAPVVDGVEEEGNYIVNESSGTILTQEDVDYMNRLSSIQSSIPLDYNVYSKRYIQVYTVEKRDKLSNILANEDSYFPMFERVFLQYGIPLEMKYLAVIESALNPNAISKSGAGGLWQFMPATGRLFGLNIDTWVDERRDPYKATVAAAQYLNELYTKFGDWHLVMASYNCGPGCIGRTVERTGIRNYWDLRPHLRAETAGYVPAFIGATYAMNFYSTHGIEKKYNSYTYEPAETVTTSRRIPFKAIAKYLGEYEDQIAYMNPELIKDCTPPYSYQLRIPLGKKELFYANYDSIINYAGSVPAYVAPVEKPKPVVTPAPKPVTPKGKSLTTHTVKKGENITLLSNKYDVEVDEIKKWNSLKSSTLAVGQKLKIYTDKKVVAEKSTSTKTTATKGKQVTHTVKSGQNLTSIANLYDVEVADIKKWNKLSSSELKVGQTLKITSNKPAPATKKKK